MPLAQTLRKCQKNRENCETFCPRNFLPLKKNENRGFEINTAMEGKKLLEISQFFDEIYLLNVWLSKFGCIPVKMSHGFHGPFKSDEAINLERQKLWARDNNSGPERGTLTREVTGVCRKSLCTLYPVA